MTEHLHQENDYTDSDIRLKPLVIFLVATLIIAVLTIIGVRYLFLAYDRESDQVVVDVMHQIESARPTNAVVEGLAEAAESLRRLRAEEDARLNHYQWVSNGTDFVQIPVARAMEILAEKKLPVRKAVAAPAAGETPVQAGQRLFTELGCIACHAGLPGGLGPKLDGVFGHEVTLADGSKVIADEAYVRESILEPMTKLVAGFTPVMPPFKGVVKDDQLDNLVAYIKSLSNP